MRRRLLAFAATEAVVAVLLAVAINVATGGTVPQLLTPYRGYAWFAVVVLSVGAIGLPVWRVIVEMPGRWSAPDYSPYHLERQRSRFLDVTERRWIQGVLAPSLRETPWIDPRLLLRPDDVLGIAEVVMPLSGRGTDLLGPEQDIREWFEELDRSMLVLGEPGSGKTTLLFELARTLLHDAREDGSAIPVFLSLSAWGPDRPARGVRRILRRGEDVEDEPAFVSWCVDQMREQYKVPRALARRWITEGSLLFLLDGLDEIASNHRADFLVALADVHRKRGPLQVAVSCRTVDYSDLPARIGLQGAVEIAPLARPAMERYLAQHDDRLRQVRDAVDEDERWWEILTTPLALYVMARIGQERALGDPAREGTDARADLLDHYIDVMVSRRSYGRHRPAHRVRRWLTTLAAATADAPSAGLASAWTHPWETALPDMARRRVLTRLLPYAVTGAIMTMASMELLAWPRSWAKITLAGAMVLVVAVPATIALVRNAPQSPQAGRPRNGVAMLAGLVTGAVVTFPAVALLLAVGRDAWVTQGWPARTLLGFAVAVGSFSLFRCVSIGIDEADPDSAESLSLAYWQMARDRNTSYKVRQRAQLQTSSDDRAAFGAAQAAIGTVVSAEVFFLDPAGWFVTGIIIGFFSAIALGMLTELARATARVPDRRHPNLVLVTVIGPGKVILALLVTVCGPWLIDALGHAHAVRPIVQNPWVASSVGALWGAGAGNATMWAVFSGKLGAAATALAARVILGSRGDLPWRLRPFLDHVTRAGLLHRVNGRRLFRHQLILERLLHETRETSGSRNPQVPVKEPPVSQCSNETRGSRARAR